MYVENIWYEIVLVRVTVMFRELHEKVKNKEKVAAAVDVLLKNIPTELAEDPKYIAFLGAVLRGEAKVPEITSLKGAPEEVGGSFYPRSAPLSSLKGAPEKF